MKLAIDVNAAARPTRAWNAATVYGSSVIGTLCPIVLPIAVAEPKRIIAYANTAGGKLRAARAVLIPPTIPVIPIDAPRVAVV